mmetsp:Transcript_12778/g.14023  ORF Transcript_12778/g.14023 Transcript_12778/m.14023 type:complete len:235 (-) Transcript_12778:220-924(-)
MKSPKSLVRGPFQEGRGPFGDMGQAITSPRLTDRKSNNDVIKPISMFKKRKLSFSKAGGKNNPVRDGTITRASTNYTSSRSGPNTKSDHKLYEKVTRKPQKKTLHLATSNFGENLLTSLSPEKDVGDHADVPVDGFIDDSSGGRDTRTSSFSTEMGEFTPSDEWKVGDKLVYTKPKPPLFRSGAKAYFLRYKYEQKTTNPHPMVDEDREIVDEGRVTDPREGIIETAMFSSAMN